jgi:hypothetical protein
MKNLLKWIERFGEWMDRLDCRLFGHRWAIGSIVEYNQPGKRGQQVNRYCVVCNKEKIRFEPNFKKYI